METAIERVRAFVKDRDWDQFHTPDNLAKSICIEAGELLECFQWQPEKYEHRAVCEELADVMIYCMQLADKLQVNMEDIILDKMEKNEKKYPVEKAFLLDINTAVKNFIARVLTPVERFSFSL